MRTKDSHLTYVIVKTGRRTDGSSARFYETSYRDISSEGGNTTPYWQYFLRVGERRVYLYVSVCLFFLLINLVARNNVWPLKNIEKYLLLLPYYLYFI